MRKRLAVFLFTLAALLGSSFDAAAQSRITPNQLPGMGVQVDAVTGTSLTPACGNVTSNTDGVHFKLFSNAGAIAVTLFKAGSCSWSPNFAIGLGSTSGAGTITVTPTTSTIGVVGGTQGATLTITAGQVYFIYTDISTASCATNGCYDAVQLNGSGSGGGGTCATQYYIFFNSSTANTPICNVGLKTDSAFDFLISGNYVSENGGYAAYIAGGGTFGTSGWQELCAEGTAPTFITGWDALWCDSTTHTLRVNENNTDSMTFTKTLNVNVTPVTVNANVTTDQNLMALQLHANDLNIVGRTIRIYAASVYSTPAASTAQMTLKAKICTVSGCGSGTVITLASIQSGALPATAVTNNAIDLSLYSTTQTAGSSATFEAHGSMLIDIAAAISAADSTYADQNTAVSSAIDTTGTLYLQITGAFSAASASNSMTERQLTVEVLN